MVAAVVVCTKVNSLLGRTLEKVDRGKWWSRFQKPAGLDGGIWVLSFPMGSRYCAVCLSLVSLG